MALEVNYQKLVGADQAYNAVKKHLTPDLVAKFKVKADFKYDEANRKIMASGKGFNLNLQFLDEKALIDLDVSFLFMAVKGAILSKIEKMLQTVL